MLSYSQFIIEEQRKRGNVSGALAAFALAGHMGVQAYRQATDPSYIARHVNEFYGQSRGTPVTQTPATPEEIAKFFKGLHAHEVGNTNGEQNKEENEEEK